MGALSKPGYVPDTIVNNTILFVVTIHVYGFQVLLWREYYYFLSIVG